MPFKNMWKNEIGLVDLLILHALYSGEASPTTLNRYLRNHGFKFSRTQLTERLNRLKKNGVVLKTGTIIIDPTKLYDYVFLAFLKIHLPSIIAGYSRGSIDWRSAFEKIRQIDKEKIVRMLFTLEGTGDYDMLLVIYVNRLEDYYDFVSSLVKEGLVEKVDGKRVHYPAGVIFDPISLPSIDEYEKALSFYSVRLQEMLNEGK